MDENVIIEIMIKEVRKCSFLWSRLDKGHSDKMKCRNAWTAIAAKVDLEAMPFFSTASNLDKNEEEDVGREDQDISNGADNLTLSDTLEQLHDKHDRSDISKTGKFFEPKEFKCRKRSYQPDMIDEALLKYLKEKSGDKDEEDLLFGKNDPY
uniref:MADF domain-containing protein n=1 Tax=Romanomermis culicivorax TaxID=13658 RepID=A0A915L107_ROMCU